MAAITGSDTRPERIVRRLIHSLGYRYRLQHRELPGTPDLVLPRYRRVVFVHGCFWHMHRCKRGKSTGGTRGEPGETGTASIRSGILYVTPIVAQGQGVSMGFKSRVGRL